MAKSIAVIGTLDTKGEEIKYIKDLIADRGHVPTVIDIGVLGGPPFRPSISNREVARASGSSLEELIALNSEARAMDKMAEGVSKIVNELYLSDRLHAALALGGTMGTSLALTVMKTLPIGVPKLVLSTIAFSPLISADAVPGDLMMMQWVAGLKGINSINRKVLDTAVGAITGGAEMFRKDLPRKKPVIGVTSHGTVPSKFLGFLRPALDKRGYELAAFHALGGGRGLELAIEEGLIDAVLDLTLAEMANQVAHGMTSAGEHRLEAAGKMGIPQIVAPTVDAIMWATGIPLPRRFKGRPFREHNWLVSNIPTNKREKVAAGKLIAKKLNKATGLIAVVIPMKGRKLHGGIFDDPEGKDALRAVLRKNLKPEIKVIEIDASVNDRVFVEKVLELLDEMMPKDKLRRKA